tara:strand:- start:2527 stop:2913 length:387 start_codon:yes stop_codon:yes gene_type:complete
MSNANLTLTQIAEQQRNALMSSNNYDGSPSDEYGSSHPNALSDGDEAGKGLTTTVGGTTDILSRQTLLNSNAYNDSNSYGSSHPNALSDGDEPGKGDTGTIGGTTDILTRTNNTSSNQFGPTNEYPNF